MSDQKSINDAVDYLYTHGAKYAEAKGHRVYLEEYRKSQKAMLMKAAMTEGKAKTAAAAEVEAYADPTYVAVNPPLVVEDPGTTMTDPDRWQPLSLSVQIGQNGVPIPGNVQKNIGSHWFGVRPFALERPAPGEP